MTSFIDEHRGEYGVEPICRVLPIAPSTYHERVAQRRDPSRLAPRVQRDEAMKPEVRRVFDANFKVYACARCGGRCNARASRLPAAQWNG
jgi:putative transposase